MGVLKLQTMENQNQISTPEKRIELFLKEVVSAPELARDLRKFKNETMRILFTLDEDLFIYKEAVSNGFFMLDELCEMLDPYLLGDQEIKNTLRIKD